jgi:hypothetical protein
MEIEEVKYGQRVILNGEYDQGVCFQRHGTIISDVHKNFTNQDTVRVRWDDMDIPTAHLVSSLEMDCN